MRALWAALTPDLAARQRAYGIDAMVEETLYAVGPLVVAPVLTVGGGSSALAFTAALNLIGTVAMATSPAAGRHTPPAPAPAPKESRLLGPFRRRGFPVLILALLGVGLGGGPMEAAVLARAQGAGHLSAFAYLLAAFSVGSGVGGLVWGLFEHRRRISAQLGMLVTIMALGWAFAAIAPTLPLLGLGLVSAGLVSAPVLIVAYLAADDLVPESGRTEATTWVNTSNNLGIALGAAVGGVIIDHSGPGTVLIAGAGVLGVTALGVFATRAGLESPARTSAAVESHAPVQQCP
jgi:predicted MFS family arabinose efflux permease